VKKGNNPGRVGYCPFLSRHSGPAYTGESHRTPQNPLIITAIKNDFKFQMSAL